MNKLIKWQKNFELKPTPIDTLNQSQGVSIAVKRDDLNHETIQGNKLRKLKYNLKFALENNYRTIATFGGAWSNHIVATAKAANLCDLQSIGFIRGDELEKPEAKWSETLKASAGYGMQLIFLSRQEYRLKQSSKMVASFINNHNSSIYMIPEGGSNDLALIGVAQIIGELAQQIDEPSHIVAACGTGGTLAGLIDGVVKQEWNTKIIGIPVLKGAAYLNDEVKKLSKHHNQANWKLYCDYHAGGYAKINQKTLQFAKEFTLENKINLDKIYNAKSFYATFDLIDKGKIPMGSSVVILHTGGLQGGII